MPLYVIRYNRMKQAVEKINWDYDNRGLISRICIRNDFSKNSLEAHLTEDYRQK